MVESSKVRFGPERTDSILLTTIPYINTQESLNLNLACLQSFEDIFMINLATMKKMYYHFRKNMVPLIGR